MRHDKPGRAEREPRAGGKECLSRLAALLDGGLVEADCRSQCPGVEIGMLTHCMYDW